MSFVKEKEELKMVSGFCFWGAGRMVGLLHGMGSGDRRSRFVERRGMYSWYWVAIRMR